MIIYSMKGGKKMKKFKIILQRNQYDCGVACLKMLLGYYGIEASMAKLRQYSGTDYSGTSVRGMFEAGKRYGLNMALSSIEKTIEQNNFPFIVLEKKKSNSIHYLVVETIQNNKVKMIDPDKGREELEYNDFLKLVYDKVIIIEQLKKVSNDSEISLSSFIIELLKNNKTNFLLITILSMFVMFFGIGSSIIYQFVYDSAILKNNKLLLYQLTGCFVIFILGKCIVNYFRQKLVLVLSKKLDESMFFETFAKITYLPEDVLQNIMSGELISRMDDLNIIRDTISSFAIQLTLDMGLGIFAGIIMFQINKYLFFIAILFISIEYFSTLLFKNKLISYSEVLMKNAANYKSNLIEDINFHEKIKCFNLQQIVLKRITKVFDEYIDSSVVLGNEVSKQLLVQEAINNLANILIVSIGGVLVIERVMSLGQIMSFIALQSYLSIPFSSFFQSFSKIQSSKVSFERIQDVIESVPEEYKGEKLSFNSVIKFQNVSFRYNFREKILDDINLEILFGKTTGIIGESGSGKTTIAKLLLQLYSNVDGSIYVDGKDFRLFDKTSIRSEIGYVSQNDSFFSGTVLDNFKIMNPKISNEEIEYICKGVGIFDHIIKLPKKFETIINSNGKDFSTGQKQRLLLALILSRHPSILILDEATANLDLETEKKVMHFIKSIPNITIIFITHRRSSLYYCDYLYEIISKKVFPISNNKLSIKQMENGGDL